MNINDGTGHLHKQRAFWFILTCTIFIPLCAALFIRSELNLVWTPDNVDSYKDIMDIFSLPVYLLSIFMAVLAFYALWFRTIQTSQQIILTQKQMEHQQKTREIESITTEINNTSSFILKLIHRIEVTPEECINIIYKSDSELTGWNYDFGSKLIRYSKTPHNRIVPWSTSIVNLKQLIGHFGEKKTIEMHKNGEVTYAHSHTTIASQLTILIMFCKKLAEIDETSYRMIQVKLSLFYEALNVLESVDLIDNASYELFYILQSLPRPEKGLDINLYEIFSREINKTGLVNRIITKADLSIRSSGTGMTTSGGDKAYQYTVVCGEQIVKRVVGEWFDITPPRKPE
ncbi:MAG: hypothetical protein JKY50_19385 [Oleispira sp.]|nr:hypothetical protein [Oleispira sp.]MBL4881117.1 hypothetical protein [Oleispira sp.]